MSAEEPPLSGPPAPPQVPQAPEIGSQAPTGVTEEQQKEEEQAPVEKTLEQKLIQDFTSERDESMERFGIRVLDQVHRHIKSYG